MTSNNKRGNKNLNKQIIMVYLLGLKLVDQFESFAKFSTL